jgi:hypothetical protein
MKLKTPGWVSLQRHRVQNKLRENFSVCSEAEGAADRQRDMQTHHNILISLFLLS